MIENKPLTGRSALVTGATSGIGRAVALKLAGQGADVIVHGRDEHRAAQVIAQIVEDGGSGRFLTADLTDAGQVLRLANLARDVDILVNGAGIYALVPTAATSAEIFDLHWTVNTRAPFLLGQVIAPAMAERGRGAIVNISSVSATMSTPFGAAYNASKAGIDAFTRSWSAEFGAAGVRVNGVSPGPVRTAGTERMTGGNAEVLGQGTIRGRIGEPEEIADVVLFLVDDRSSYLNGSIVVADGGERITLPIG